jgi:hypothetical protein
MGLRDRIAKIIATNQLDKAPNLPAGATTMTETEMRNRAGGSIGQSYGNNVPLPRNPWLGMVPQN